MTYIMEFILISASVVIPNAFAMIEQVSPVATTCFPPPPPPPPAGGAGAVPLAGGGGVVVVPFPPPAGAPPLPAFPQFPVGGTVLFGPGSTNCPGSGYLTASSTRFSQVVKGLTFDTNISGKVGRVLVPVPSIVMGAQS